MSSKRIQEWLGSVQGLLTTIFALGGIAAGIWTSLQNAATNLFPPQWAPYVSKAVPGFFFAVSLIWLIGNYRKFARASRIELPQQFTLKPKGPADLIGREEDLQGLIQGVTESRIVFLAGESGCGKSVLVSTGLVPSLNRDSGLLPVFLDGWGDDWLKGPATAALGAIWRATTQDERQRLGWNAPDLAASTDSVLHDLKLRLAQIHKDLFLRPLIIADQFDDYQAAHHERFFAGGKALNPDELAANPFWHLICDRLDANAIHLLVVTRNDTALGLRSVRFLPLESIRELSLSRVESDLILQVLQNVAPDGSEPEVVSHPENGWLDLRESIAADLKGDLLLFQQVHTILLGLRGLALLTPRHYVRADRIAGLEALAVTGAVRKAARAASTDETVVRKLLAEMVLAPTAHRPPKTQPIGRSQLAGIAGGAEAIDLALKSLSASGIVRPAPVHLEAPDERWQLDHDYLARAVLADARNADRWAVSLAEGSREFARPGQAIRSRWAALLPIGTWFGILWARLRGRLRLAEHASYFGLSSAKPVAALLLVVLSGLGYRFWQEDQRSSEIAQGLVHTFGTDDGPQSTLKLWGESDAVRLKVWRGIQSNPGLMCQALDDKCLLGVAGTHAPHVDSVARDVLAKFIKEKDADVANRLSVAYASLAPRLSTGEADREAAVLREKLIVAKEFDLAYRLASTYTSLALRMSPEEADKGAKVFRERFVAEKDADLAYRFATAYGWLAQRMSTVEADRGAQVIREKLAAEKDPDRADHLATAYASLALRVSTREADEGARVLRQRFAAEKDPNRAETFATEYASLAPRVSAREADEGAKVLRERLAVAEDAVLALRLGEAYSSLVRRMSTEGADRELKVLRQRLITAKGVNFAYRLGEAYESLAQRLSSRAAAKEAKILLDRLIVAEDVSLAYGLATAYASLAPQLSTGEVEEAAKVLRERLIALKDDRLVYATATAYVPLALQLSTGEADEGAKVLRKKLAGEKNSFVSYGIVTGYATLVPRLSPREADRGAQVVRDRLLSEKDSYRAEKFAIAYASLAPRMSTGEADREAEVLSERLAVSKDYGLLDCLATAYAPLAPRTSTGHAGQQAKMLRERLFEEKEDVLKAPIARAYASLVPQMSMAQADQEAKLFCEKIATDKDGHLARRLANAYSSLASKAGRKQSRDAFVLCRDRILQTADNDNLEKWVEAIVLVIPKALPESPDRVRELLTLATHPFLNDPTPLLKALKPDIVLKEGEGLMEAIAQAEKKFGIKPSELRPKPVR